jgi:hypothetical protein
VAGFSRTWRFIFAPSRWMARVIAMRAADSVRMPRRAATSAYDRPCSTRKTIKRRSRSLSVASWSL